MDARFRQVKISARFLESHKMLEEEKSFYRAIMVPLDDSISSSDPTKTFIALDVHFVYNNKFSLLLCITNLEASRLCLIVSCKICTLNAPLV
jgi:hypothetical protein